MLADISMEKILEMTFSAFFNINICLIENKP